MGNTRPLPTNSERISNMARYRVYLQTIASTVIEVEAEDGDEAVEKAFEQELPYAPAFADYEFSEWQTASDMFPQSAKPEDDYKLMG